MAQLPQVGGDENTWGQVLNEFLEVSHNDDGTLKEDSLVYKGFLSQTGETAPTMDIVLKDDFETPVWSYSSTGIFLLTKASAFTATKTIPDKAEVYIDNDGNKMTLEHTSADVMTLKTYAAADTTVLANGVITGQFINIEVYI